MIFKKIKIIFLLFSLIIFSSCEIVNIKYSGEQFKPTKHVELFFSKKNIKKNYEVMGQAYVSSENETVSNEIENAIKEKAERVGANAVVIQSYNIIPQQASLDGDPGGYDTYSPGYPDQPQPNDYWNSGGMGGGVGLNNSVAGPEMEDEYYEEAVVKVLFIKYIK
ncbi:MAG: hypothetical protein GY756_22925 [bacterium]|nr:hypothetical protein [bacterium]